MEKKIRYQSCLQPRIVPNLSTSSLKPCLQIHVHWPSLLQKDGCLQLQDLSGFKIHLFPFDRYSLERSHLI
jgi:hypothetical protein